MLGSINGDLNICGLNSASASSRCSGFTIRHDLCAFGWQSNGGPYLKISIRHCLTLWILPGPVRSSTYATQLTPLKSIYFSTEEQTAQGHILPSLLDLLELLLIWMWVPLDHWLEGMEHLCTDCNQICKMLDICKFFPAFIMSVLATFMTLVNWDSENLKESSWSNSTWKFWGWNSSACG